MNATGSKYFKRLFRAILFAAAASLIVGCHRECSGRGITGGTAAGTDGWHAGLLKAGGYYRACTDSSTCFFLVDVADAESVSGKYYMAGSSGAVASPQAFTATITTKNVTISSGGKTTELRADNLAGIKVTEYHEPAFEKADLSLYRKGFSEVTLYPDVVYGHATGYWTSLPGAEEDVSKVFTEGYSKSFTKNDLDLTMDIYVPESVEGPRPLILFFHGGAFYVGDKAEKAYVDFCRHFASMGYVTASANYRMGFHVGKSDVERAGYIAAQDGHAAMRYLVAHASEYGIDTDRLFLAGSSAGSITALNLTFMKDKYRPASSWGGEGLFKDEDLGPIDSSGNDIQVDFHITAIANMWGAVSTIEMLASSSTDIISFHGTEDRVVPYVQGYPFESAGTLISRTLSDPVYGSVCIDAAAKALGYRSELYSFEGAGHALNTEKRTKEPNANHNVIKERMTDFFFSEIIPEEVTIVDMEKGEYTIAGEVEGEVSWKATGGFILKSGDGKVKVLWRSDAPERCLEASGYQKDNIGFLIQSDTI